MIVSWNWLKEYVPLDMSEAELVDRLMMAGLNHESTTEVAGDLAIDLEVTSNRPDCLGHVGIAREVALLFGHPLTFPATQFEEGDADIESITSVTLDPSATGWCRQYRARVIENLTVGPSPSWLKRRLETLGLASINNVVDVTNYVLMETGQPLHAFDLDRLAEQRIVVRSARAKEAFIAINNRSYELSPEVGVIADAKDAQAIAGVMGGKQSEVTEKTRRILLESAEFAPLAVRRSGRGLDLASDSSYRFERKIDPAGVTFACERACHLLAQLCTGRVARGAIHHVAEQDSPQPISFRPGRVQRLLGIEIPKERCQTILSSLGLKVENTNADDWSVTPPSFRRDLTREVDLIEEIGRVHGYESVPQDRPIPIRVAPLTKDRRVRDRVRSVLLGSGFREAMTFSFTDSASVARIRPWTTSEPITLQHSSRKHENRLRQSLLPSLLEAVRLNQSRGNHDVRIFEWASIYLSHTGGSLPEEPTAIGLAGTVDDRTLRGVVDAILAALGIPFEFSPEDVDGFEPGASAVYRVQGDRVAVLGAASQKVKDQIDLRGNVWLAEILLPKLIAGAQLETHVRPIPDQPAVERDLAVVVDQGVPWAKIEQIVRQNAGEHLEQVSFVDLYRGKQVGAGQKSIALRMRFRAQGRTLTREEVDADQKRVVDQLSAEVGGQLRS